MTTKEKRAAWYVKNRARILTERRRRYWADPETNRAESRRRYRANPGQWIANSRRLRGVPEPTRPMPAACECCEKPPRNGKPLHIDHNHETGEFRGWLCYNCNVGIGHLGDTLGGAKNAVRYLQS